MIQVGGEEFRLNAGKLMRQANEAQDYILVTHYNEPYMVLMPVIKFFGPQPSDPNCPHCANQIHVEPSLFGATSLNPEDVTIHCGSCGDEVTLQRFVMPHVRVKE